MARATRKRPFGAAPKSAEKGRRPRVNIPLFAESLDLRQSTVPQPLELRAPVPSISIGLVDWDAVATWRIEVEVSTAAGIRRLGTVITTAPALAADPTRNRIVAIAYCPGALGWSLQIRPVAFGTTAQPATLSVTGTQCCAGPPGVVTIEPFATPLVPTTEGILIVQTFAAAANVNGGNGLIYVVEGQSFYLWVPGDPVTPDGVVHIQGVAGPVAGNWVHQGDDLYLTPLGGTPAADDWPRLMGLVMPALATHGKRLVTYEGAFQAKTVLPIPNGASWLASDRASIVSTLPTGAATDAPIVSAPVFGAGTTFAAANIYGSNVVSLNAALPVGARIILSNATLVARVHTIVSVAGAGPFLHTLDRGVLYAFAIADVASVITSAATDIEIDFGGALVTGACARYVELGCALRCNVRNGRFAPSAAGHATDIMLSFDIGSYECTFENLDLDGGAFANQGLALESAEASYIDGCSVRLCNQGIVLLDCSDCDVIETHASDCAAAALLFGTDAAVTGCFDCRAISGTYTGSVSGIQITGASVSTKLIGCAMYGNVQGLTLTTCDRTTIEQCDMTFNTSIGLAVGAGATKTSATDIDISNNTVVCLQGSGDIDMDGVVATSAVGAAVIANFAATAHIRGFEFTHTAGASNVIAIGAGARVHLDEGLFTPANGDNAINNSGLLSLENVRIAGGAGVNGIVLTAGTVRLGQAVDLSATAILAAGGLINRGNSVLNGVVAVVVAWPDLRATDDVLFARTVAGGAPGFPVITPTPGVGFQFVSTAADNGTLSWRVVG